ncbi:MAG: DUF6519 domain-containing protein, partial [Anaerolineae bacterium]|nr:DUF6519 domain-containing protein [Anaerolineae bacterium]
VGPGHYYVNGILCENEDLVNLNEQADLPAYLDQLAPGSGLYVVYLDVWKRHITYIEDAAILETALGGVDTATRAKTVWQVRLVRVGNVGDAFNCLTDSSAYDNAIAASTGQMRARVQPGETSDDPCVIEPGAGYRRLENQLYRVEIHTPGPRGTATFVWSRINGSHVTRLEDEIGGELVVESTGRDEFLRFAPNQWVEVSDDTSELYGLPGVMLRLQKVEGNALTIDTTTPGSGPFDKTLYTNNPKVRGWDSQGQIATSTRWTPLEDGIEVRFEDGEYHTGDYWLIPARVATSSIEWPQEISGSAINWLPKVNDGIEHDYCRLAVVSRAADGTFTLLEDCRNLFPPLTELTRFFYVGGDGQETLPGQPIPKPLQVGVMNGLMPVEGVSVRFTAEEVLGRVAAVPADPNDIPTVLADGSTTNEVIVQTDADGVARCVWRPASDPPAQQVRAALLLTDGSYSTHPDLVFTGNLSLASQVAYDPSNCDTLAAAGADTVQAAIDELCKMQQPDDPGIRIIRIESSGVRLENDSPVSLDQLRKGVTVIFDNPVDKASIKRPVCSMTLELPISFAQGTQGPRLTIPPVVYQPLVLEASLNPAGDRLTWVLAPRTADWLQNFIMPVVQEMNARLLLWLRLKGNFIWSIPDRSLYLDGQAYGVLKGGITALDLPSGDGKRGGDFEMWMWLTPPEIAPTRGLNWSIEGAPNVGPLDPARVNDLADWTAITLMYAGLVRLDEDLTVQPDLAESFDVSNNNQVFTFTLRGDTAFSNGMPVSAGDVAFSLDRARQLIGGWSGPFYLDNIAEIQVIDDQTVQITLKQPAPHFLFQLTTAPARIIAAQFGG